VGGFIQENGYTFTPFGLPNPSSECYAGTESFALTSVLIAATVGTAAQTSTDQVFGLYPHPKIESISPNSGFPGETLDVTIEGQYFLRADDFAPNTGSVSLGPNITVTNYKIDSSNPINNSITATITIDGDAPVGPRNVNVTSCFGYSSGSGTAPYLSGVLTDGFTVLKETPSPVGGTIYPINKLAILAPWIALAALLAGGLSWLTLRRRRAHS